MECSNFAVSAVSCLAEVVLAICAVIALLQLRISKEQLKRQKEEFLASSRRDAIKAAIEQIRYYSAEIIPSYNSLCKKIREKDISFFYDNSVSMENGCFNMEKFIVKEGDVEKIKMILSELGDVSNKMENFSVCIVSGVANQEFAFNALSGVFCSEVRFLLPFYAMTHEKGANSSQEISATLQLYENWKERIKLRDLQQEKRKIEEQLEKIAKK